MPEVDAPPQSEAAFYFDLSSPLAYLAAEQVLHVFSNLPIPVQWQPVLAVELGRGAERFDAFRCQDEEMAFREKVERRALELDLQPLVWPSRFPFDSTMAMRVATYAKSIGRTVPFVQAAFRQAFAAGRALDDFENVLIAAAACEMHPRAVSQSERLRSIGEELRQATLAASNAGVSDVPAVRVHERVWVGEHALEDAASAMMDLTGPR
ncbi:MAG TPA: DsbA family protein [Solirubrobacteraceae bacterium]|jgi:2-hydroxychromene-2-carboxylate isomerase